jgi:hypothetical protein
MDKLRSSYYLKLKYVIIEISSLKAFFFFFGPKNKNELHGTDEINLTRGLAFVSALGRKTHHHQGGPARFVFSLLPEVPKFPTSVSARHARPCVTKHSSTPTLGPVLPNLSGQLHDGHFWQLTLHCLFFSGQLDLLFLVFDSV